MEFKDIGILPEDSPYYQEASRIFFEALEANINPPLLIAALLNLKKARNGDETLFMEDVRIFEEQFKEQLEHSRKEQNQ